MLRDARMESVRIATSGADGKFTFLEVRGGTYVLNSGNQQWADSL